MKKKKGGVVPQKSTLKSFNPEDAARGEILIKPSKKKKKGSTKITISVRPNYKFPTNTNNEMKLQDLRCWINGKRVKNPKITINWKSEGLKY